MTINNSQSFKYKAALAGKTADPLNNTNSSLKNTKIVVTLKYLSNFWRSQEMPLINCNANPELNWIEDWILFSAGDSAKFTITDAKFYVTIVTLSTKDNINLTKQWSDGFKRPVYWNNYLTIPAKVIHNETNIYELLRASFQGARRLFVLAYDATDDNEAGTKDNKNDFLPRAKVENCNALIDGRNFYDQPINDLIK